MEDCKRIREMKLEGRYYNEENYERGGATRDWGGWVKEKNWKEKTKKQELKEENEQRWKLLILGHLVHIFSLSFYP